MHEGNTIGVEPSYDYSQSLTFAGETFAEFPMVDGNRETPNVIAKGVTTGLASLEADGGAVIDITASSHKDVSTLSVYEGRNAGVGRIVTGSTFHHYIDINLSGDSTIVANTPGAANTSSEAEKGHGFNDAPARFDDIKAVYLNIVDWLARPRRGLQLILDRSTFSQAEAGANPVFDPAIMVIVDGLKPNQFPAGGITSLAPGAFQSAWAPSVTPSDPTGFTIEPTKVESDDPTLSDRLQRFTFTYRVVLGATAFGFAGNFKNIPVTASLATPATSTPLTASATVQLVKSANPFMLDLADNNTTAWLSSDVRVFPLVAGASRFGFSLPYNASRDDALAFLTDVLGSMDAGAFESLSMDEEASALSPFPTGTLKLLGLFDISQPVYNFAIARVRLPAAGASANDVRVFFRLFTTQTTGSVTYNESPPGTPLEGYRKTTGATPIDLPGIDATGNQWLSFPMFQAPRVTPPEAQTDPINLKGPLAPGSDTFFGALIDSNFGDPYLPMGPGGAGAVNLPTLLMGEHQCLIAQIEFAGTPIPNGADPYTSDKLSQRNIALSAIANPGLDASRMALHTFEIAAAPNPISAERPPDELLFDWRREPPDGTEVEIYIAEWNARDVIELADHLYARHEIRFVDEHTVAVPGGGARYVPIPKSHARQTGVISANFPLGVKKGQRFDLSVRQVTTRWRSVDAGPKVQKISREEAARLLASLKIATRPVTRGAKAKAAALPRGVFDLGKNKVLVTNLTVFDDSGDHALVIQHPSAKQIESARQQSWSWRQTVGAFQLGIPVSVNDDMLVHYLRLLSVMRWRAETLRPKHRWYSAFRRYVEMIALKVRALGGDPWAVPPTPGGIIDLPGLGVKPPIVGGAPAQGDNGDGFFEPGHDDWLGGTDGLEPAGKAHAAAWSGKVGGLLFNHFGDFEGFVLETYGGGHIRFFSQEAAILEIARTAWLERYVVTVLTVSAQSRRIRRVLVRGYPD